MISARDQGNIAESMASRYLEEHGLTLLERNYRCRAGELDLIMQDGRYLVFVEVRCRRNERYGTAAETVTKVKQQRLIRAAHHYLQRSRSNSPCRFDIIAITQMDQTITLEWIQNAFQVA
jgi:putative endonuclease